MADKTVRIVIKSDVTEGVAGFTKLNQTLDKSSVAVTKFQTTTSTNAEGLKSYVHTIDLASKKLKDLQTATEQARVSLIPKADSTVSSTYDATAQARQAAKERIALARDIAKEEVAAAKLAEQAERLRAKAATAATAQLQANRQASSAIFKQETSNILQNLDQRLALEQAKRVHGANSNKVIALKAAQDEYNIRKKLASDIAALDASIQQGANRSRVNSQRTSLISNASNQISAIQNAVPKEVIDSHRSLATHILEIIGLYRVMNFAISTVISSLKAIPKIGIQLESTIASLTSTVGSGAGAASTMKALNDEAQRTGITIDTLRTSFRTFQASTSLAGESLESTWRMFTNINTVATALHLTTDQTNGVFLALAQIFNKTKVQSEELVKQLGNLLPGAFASFAAANRDMFKNSADLIAKMKLGVVTAHETVEKFTEFMANRFKEAFNLASLGLNANVGRMQTSFTLLGEAIYGVTSGAMLDFVKGTSEIVNYLTEAVKGTNNFAEVVKQLAIVGFSALVGSVGASILKLEVFKGALTAAALQANILKASVAFLSSPTIIIAGIAAIAAEIYHLGNAFTENSKVIDNFFDKLAQGKAKAAEVDKIKLEVDADPAVQGTIAAIKAIDAEIAKYRESAQIAKLKGGLGLLAPEKEAIARSKLLIAQRAKAEEILEEQRATALSAIQLKNAGENAQALDAYQNKRTQMSIAAERARGNEVNAARMQADQQYKELVEKAKKEIESIEKVPSSLRSEASSGILAQAKKDLADYQAIYDAAGQVKARKQAISEVKGDYKEITETIKTATKEIATDFAYNESRYSQNLITLKEYLAEKKSLIDAELESKSSLQRGLISVASNAGDTSKVNQAEEELLRLKEEHEKKLIALSTEGYDKKLTQISTLRSIEIDYYNAIGQADKAITLQYEDKYAIIKESLQRQIDAGDTLKQIDLDRINSLEKLAVVESQVAIAKASVQGKLNLTAADQERINVLRNIGAISELTAAQQLSGVYEKEIELKQRLIDIDVKRLESLPQGTSAYQQLKDDIDQATASLENFKLTSNTVGQYFQTQLTPAFTNAFTGFITGSMTAKEAFASFAQDMLKRIADIAAQELASQLIGGLIGAFGGASSSFGSGYNATTGLGNTSVNYGLANGGATIGLSSAKNTILTSPTYFPNAKPVPFATGGILAGEAGAEAVLPLKRTANGKLGVETTGQNGSTNGIIIQNMNISVDSKEGSTSKEQADEIGKAIKLQMQTLIDSRISNAQRPGGLSNPTQLATSF